MKRETKYKVGDKVLIKENLYECVNVNSKMCEEYAGRVMTIEEIDFEDASNYPYRMLEDEKTWDWGDNHIECRIFDAERVTPECSVGDKVKLKSLAECRVLYPWVSDMDSYADSVVEVEKFCAGLTFNIVGSVWAFPLACIDRVVEDEPQEVLTDSWAQLFGF